MRYLILALWLLLYSVQSYAAPSLRRCERACIWVGKHCPAFGNPTPRRCRRLRHRLGICEERFAPSSYTQPHLGPEFQVNTYTPGLQLEPSVAVSDDSFVISWTSGEEVQCTPSASNDLRSGVFLQRFDISGAPLGPEQHVNTFTLDDQQRSDVSIAPDGRFVVVWESGCSDAPDYIVCDTADRAVALQTFDANGAPVGGEQIVDNLSTDVQHPGRAYSPQVRTAPTGEFVVTWSSVYSGNPVWETLRVSLRRFDANSAPLTDEQGVSESTLDAADPPGIAVDHAGTFVIVWSDRDQLDYSGFPMFVRGRHYDASGALLADFEVTGPVPYAIHPAVAAAPDGNFMVVWHSRPSGTPAFVGGDILGRRFAPDATPLGEVFTVNTQVAGNQHGPAIATDTAGNCVVTWASFPDIDAIQDDGESGIFAQAFSPDGSRLGSEFQVASSGFQPAIAAGPAGKFLVTWVGTFGQDGAGGDIFARMLSIPACASD